MWTFLPTEGSDPRSAALRSVVDGFNAAQKEYQVKVESINFARIDNVVIQSTAAGQGPDILNVYSDQLPMHVAARTVVPLTSLFAALPEAVRKDFVHPLKFFTFKDELMALPWETRVWLLWYRRDLLEKAGVAVPKTLDELGTVAAKISTDQVMGFGFGASTAALAAGAMETFLPLLWAAGGELFDGAGKATFNSDAGVKVLGYFRDLTTKHQGMRTTIVSMSVEDGMSSVRAGTLGMTIMGSFRVGAARNSPATGANLATAPIPGWTADKPSPARLAGQTLTIGANTKHRDGAWKFIQHYVSPQSQLAFARAGVMPSRLSSYGDAFFKQDPVGIEMAGWTKYAHDHGRLAATPADFSKASENIAKAIQEVLIQGADPKRALDTAARNYDAQHKE
jgi:ABC-type glycerol-3-phosphate transport system substrate-binding protein